MRLVDWTSQAQIESSVRNVWPDYITTDRGDQIQVRLFATISHWVTSTSTERLRLTATITFIPAQPLIDFLTRVGHISELRTTLLEKTLIGVVGAKKVGKSRLLSQLWGLQTNPSSTVATLDLKTFHARPLGGIPLSRIILIDWPGLTESSSVLSAAMTELLPLLQRTNFCRSAARHLFPLKLTLGPFFPLHL